MLKIHIKTFGWPLVQVPQDDFGDIKDGKCFGVKGIGKILKPSPLIISKRGNDGD